MSGQATVTIGESLWAVSVASTTAELLAGLSGVESIPTNTGMLFDLGADQESISVNMADMLFSLDIAFINSAGGVVGVLRNVAPGEAAAFDAGSGLGARWFLEVNAGEMADVSVGDTVDISGYEAGVSIDLNLVMQLVVIAGMSAIAVKAIAGHHSIHGPERDRLVRMYGSWAVGRAESVCAEGDVECVRSEAARLAAMARARTYSE